MATRYRFRYSHSGGTIVVLDWGQTIDDDTTSNPLLLGKDRNSPTDCIAYVTGAAPNGLAQTIDNVGGTSTPLFIALFTPDTTTGGPGVRPGNTDPDAVHLSVGQEFNGLVTKRTANANDVMLIEDSEDNGSKKALLLSSIMGATPPPAPGPTDLRYGLSPQSDPANVVFGALTDVASPTDPQTVMTGTAAAGHYFHIFSVNTHDIQTIRDTVLDQIVYEEGGSGNIFTKVSDVRTESTVTYDSYTIGPLNAGVDESYVLSFS